MFLYLMLWTLVVLASRFLTNVYSPVLITSSCNDQVLVLYVVLLCSRVGVPDWWGPDLISDTVFIILIAIRIQMSGRDDRTGRVVSNNSEGSSARLHGRIIGRFGEAESSCCAVSYVQRTDFAQTAPSGLPITSRSRSDKAPRCGSCFSSRE